MSTNDALTVCLRWVIGRPVSAVWLSAMFMLALAVQNFYYFVAAAVVLAFIATSAVLIAVQREVHVVHNLVNSEHDRLVRRVQQLEQHLIEQDVPTPPEEL